MLTGLGGFAGGLAGGIQAGESLQDQMLRRQQQQQAFQAQKLLASAFLQPQQAGAAGQGAMPGNAPMPGQASQPMQQPAPQQPSQQGGLLSGIGSLFGRPQQPQGTPLGGAPQVASIASGPQGLQAMIQNVVRNNPGMTQEQLAAVIPQLVQLQSSLGMMDYRGLMAQAAMQNAGTRAQMVPIAQERADTQRDIGGQNVDLRRQSLADRIQYHENVQRNAVQRMSQAQERINNAKTEADRKAAQQEYVNAEKEVRAAAQDRQKVRQQLIQLETAAPATLSGEEKARMKSEMTGEMNAAQPQKPAQPKLTDRAAGPSPDDIKATIANAKAAIAQGRDPQAIRDKLKQNGIDPNLLDQ